MTLPLPADVFMLRWTVTHSMSENRRRRRFYTKESIAVARRDVLLRDPSALDVELYVVGVEDRWRLED